MATITTIDALQALLERVLMSAVVASTIFKGRLAGPWSRASPRPPGGGPARWPWPLLLARVHMCLWGLVEDDPVMFLNQIP